MKYQIIKKTIKQYVDAFYAKIDCQPVGQRLPVTQGDALYGPKAQGIIGSILDGQFFGTITLVKISDTELYEFEFEMESLDGGHRKRFVFAYVDNQFPVRGKLFDQLTKKEQKAFLETELHFCIYEPLTIFMKGKIFRDLNTSTDVNFIEMLNSYGNIPVANYIRETVRVVPQIANSEHQLFEMAETSPRYLDFSNKRLIHDLMFARIVYCYTQDEYLCGADDFNLEDMYNDETIDVSALEEKCKAHLNFLRKMAVVRKGIFSKGLSMREFKMLSYVWFYLQDTYKKFTIKDMDAFYESFKKAFDVISNNKGKYAAIPVDLPWEERAINVQDAFIKYLGAPGDTKKTVQTIKYLLQEFDIEKVITPLDKKRAFTKFEKEQKLSEQNFRCAIDGDRLSWDDAHAAHIDAYINGNPTVYSNLAMVRKEYNIDMKTMSVNEYKEMKDAA